MRLGSQIAPAIKASNDIAVVVNANNPFNTLTSEDLRKILLGERRFWKGNVQVALILRQEGVPERDRVLQDILKMSNADFERIWQAKMFRGEASALPLAVPSNGMVSEYVADTPGAISFVVGKNLPPDLKVLKIDGKLPGEPGYLIK
jgi:ABC-type phosphate transport system substrate-binding protein